MLHEAKVTYYAFDVAARFLIFCTCLGGHFVVYAVAMVELIRWLVGGVCWAAMLLFVLLLPWLRLRHFLCDGYGA